MLCPLCPRVNMRHLCCGSSRRLSVACLCSLVDCKGKAVISAIAPRVCAHFLVLEQACANLPVPEQQRNEVHA